MWTEIYKFRTPTLYWLVSAAGRRRSVHLAAAAAACLRGVVRVLAVGSPANARACGRGWSTAAVELLRRRRPLRGTGK